MGSEWSCLAVRSPRCPLRERVLGVARQTAQNGRVALRLPQEIEVPPAADPVRDRAREAQRRIEGAEARHDHAARLARHGHSRHRPSAQHRSLEPLRDLGGRPRLGGGARAVVEAHHPLDERHVGFARGAGERGGAPRRVPSSSRRGCGRGLDRAGVVSGIEVVLEAALEDRHAEAARAEGAGDGDRDRGLAHAAGHAGDDRRGGTPRCPSEVHADLPAPSRPDRREGCFRRKLDHPRSRDRRPRGAPARRCAR